MSKFIFYTIFNFMSLKQKTRFKNCRLIMKKALILLIFFTIALNAMQTDSTKIPAVKDRQSIRQFFFSCGIIGCPDVFSLNLGYQLNENFSLSVKGSLFAIAGSEWGGIFTGFRIGYHSNEKLLLVFNTYGFELNHSVHAFELTAGYENISVKLFSFYWAVGLSGSISKYEAGEPVKYLPVLKWGVNLNF